MYTRPSRPRSAAGVFNDALLLYRASARGWWLASVLAALSGLACSLYVERAAGPEPTLEGLLAMVHSPVVWRAYGLDLLASVYLYCVMIANINGTCAGGEPRPVGGFAAALRALPAALIATILSLLVTAAGLLLLLIPGLWLFGRLQFWPVALMAEGRGAGAALLRSSGLVRGHWWHASTAVSIAVLLVFTAGFALDLVSLAIAAVGGLDGTTAMTMSESLGALLKACIAPLVPAAYVAAYHDLRLRQEQPGVA